MVGYALAPGNPHASEDYARACVPMGKGEAKSQKVDEEEARLDGKGRNSCKHFTLRGSPRVARSSRGLIFLFNPS